MARSPNPVRPALRIPARPVPALSVVLTILVGAPAAWGQAPPGDGAGASAPDGGTDASAPDRGGEPQSAGEGEPSSAAPQAIDVLVEGDGLDTPVHAPAERGLGAREYGRIPGAFGDAFRAIEVLPGVSAMASGLPALLVRGSTPSATGYYLDGIQIPFLFHLLVGPSVVHPAFVERVDFFPGAYPARFGRQVGGIVSASIGPPAPALEVQGSLRLFDAGAYADVPLDDGRAHVFGGARYSYTAAIFSLVAPDTRLSYWDYQLGASYAPSPDERVRLLGFGSHDYLGKVEGDGDEQVESELFAADFHRLELRLETVPSAEFGAHRLVALGFGYDRTGLGPQGVATARTYRVRAEGDVPAGRAVRFRGGVDFEAVEHAFEREAEPSEEPARRPGAPSPTSGDDGFQFDLPAAFGSRLGATLGAHLDAVLRPVEELEIVPGLRVDAFSERDLRRLGVDPRLSVRVRPTPWLALVAAAGISHQRGSVGVAVPGLEPAGLELQRAIQVAPGVELDLPGQVQLTATFFHHDYASLSDIIASCGPGVESCSFDDRTGGSANGLELGVSRSFSERFAGMLSYTLSRTVRTVGGRTFLSDFDRTHVLHVAFGVNFGRGWHAGARLTAYSGKPFSLIAFDDPSAPTEPTLIGRRNALRGDPFHRIDLRIEKRWTIEERGFVSLVLEGMNITLQKEQLDFDCRVSDALGNTGLGCGQQEIGPIAVPSLGVVGGI